MTKLCVCQTQLAQVSYVNQLFLGVFPGYLHPFCNFILDLMLHRDGEQVLVSLFPVATSAQH